MSIEKGDTAMKRHRHPHSKLRINWFAVSVAFVAVVAAVAFFRSLVLSLSASASGAKPDAGSADAESRPQAVIVGLDVSASSMAKDLVRPLTQLRGLILDFYDAQLLEVLCFDMRTSVLYSGEPPRGEEPATALINHWLRVGVDPKNFGTSLPNFVRTVDSRLQELPKPVRIVILTDHGTEGVSEKELRQCREITEAWQDEGQVSKVTILGLRTTTRGGSLERIEKVFPKALLEIRGAE